MKRTTILFASLVAIPLVACGGSADPATTSTTPGGTKPATAVGADLTLKIDARELSGIATGPEAIGRPALPQVNPKKALTLDKHRAEFKSASAGDLEIKGQVLATRLFNESREATEPATTKALLDEAYKVLTDIRTKTAGKTAVVTLRMLGFQAYTQLDFAAAENVFTELVERFATDPAALEFKTYRAYAAIKQHRYSAALEALAGIEPKPLAAKASEEDTAAAAEAYYVLAWARFGTGTAGAFDAIREALAIWKSAGSRPAVEADLLLIAARTGIAEDTAAAAVKALVPTESLYGSLFQLSNAYASSGRFGDASKIIDKTIAAGGAAIAPSDLAKLRLTQMQYDMRVGDPVATAAAAKAAMAVAPAGTAKTDAAAAVLGIAKLFHTVYATSLDEAYYPPTKSLYLDAAVGGNAAQKAEAEGLTAQLDQTKTNSKAGSGLHDLSVIGPLVQMHDLNLIACYEQGLLVTPTLGGVLSLTLDVSATGEVVAATTDPAAGKEGLAAVGGCVEAAARGWRFSARTMPGQTKISASYTLAPRK